MPHPDRSLPQIILCLPGNWQGSTDLVNAIAKKSGGYLFAGMAIMNIATRQASKLMVRGPDPKMGIAFSHAGRHWANKDDLERIDSHSLVLYLLHPGGSPDQARSAMDFACGLLRAGGLAVKVETAGIAHNEADWLKMSERKTAFDLIRAFVVVVTGKETAYSCGMRHFGLRDVVVTGSLSGDEAARLVNRFILYVLAENPTLKERETFSVSADAPRYRLSAEPCTPYAPGEPFHNPYGMWRLAPVGGR